MRFENVKREFPAGPADHHDIWKHRPNYTGVVVGYFGRPKLAVNIPEPSNCIRASKFFRKNSRLSRSKIGAEFSIVFDVQMLVEGLGQFCATEGDGFRKTPFDRLGLCSG